jgi:hypothetical protein
VSVTTDQVSVAWRYRELGVAAPFLRGTFLCPVTLADGSDGLVCTETADDSAIAAFEFALDTKLRKRSINHVLDLLAWAQGGFDIPR